MRRQRVDRGLPLAIRHFRSNPIVGDDARIMLGERHEDQYAGAVLGAADAANDELLDGGTMRARPLQRTRDQQKPKRHP